MTVFRLLKVFRRTFEANLSVRRALLLLVVFVSLLLYTGRPFYRWLFSSSYKNTYQFHDEQAAAAVAGTCIDQYVRPFSAALRSRDAVLSLTSLPATPISATSAFAAASPSLPPAFTSSVAGATGHQHRHVPLVGNGHVALLVPSNNSGRAGDSGGALLIGWSGRTLDVHVPYRPAMVATPGGASGGASGGAGRLDAEAVLVHYRDGVVHRWQCWSVPVQDTSAAAPEGATVPVHVSETFAAHRRRAGLIVQRTSVWNGGQWPVSVLLSQPAPSDWAESTSRSDSVLVGGQRHAYTTHTGVVKIRQSTGPAHTALSPSVFTADSASSSSQPMYSAVVIATSHVPTSVTMEPMSQRVVSALTWVNYTETRITGRLALNRLSVQRMANSTATSLADALAQSTDALLESHSSVWRHHWRTGFSLSHSLADDVINGDLINATIYYVLSQVPAPLHQLTVSGERVTALYTSLAGSAGCYGDSLDTLQASKLWSPLQSLQHVLDTARLWVLLLEKKGCHELVSAGADGVVQAMVLSMGALRFVSHHLELGLRPSHMHRDYHFRNIRYDNATLVNISVTVDSDNLARLAVSAVTQTDHLSPPLRSPPAALFACDAGCLDAPVQLGADWSLLPVKQTEPPSAVLYITDNWQHVQELKHTIHVKEISLAPAHDTQLISLHRHGHTLGTVPLLFWLCFFLLVVAFHVFLVKIIVNEYCAPTGGALLRQPRARKSSDYKDTWGVRQRSSNVL